MDSRRILITGLSSRWGGRLAQVLEREPSVDAIVGVDSSDPQHELERTEFVRVDMRHALLRRIIKAAEIDTVIDTRLVVDPLAASPKAAREINVSGTRGILEACSAHASPVRKFVLKSSAHWYGCEPDDPAFFSEGMDRRRPPRTAIERDIVAAEEATTSFATRNPTTTVTVLRFASAIGAEQGNSEQALLGMPAVPAVLGFDPRCQFIHEDDLVGALAHATRERLAGSYNAAADGVLALSEVVSLLGKPMLPVLPPWGTVVAADQLRRLGFRIPVELLRGLRYGRALDNRRLKASGYVYRYTTREAILKLRAQQRLRPLLGGGPEPFRYEPDVEEFLRWSPSVRAASRRRERGEDELADSGGGVDVVGPPVPSYDELSAEEVIGIVASLEAPALAELRRYEVANRSRTAVLAALDRNLASKRD